MSKDYKVYIHELILLASEKTAGKKCANILVGKIRMNM